MARTARDSRYEPPEPLNKIKVADRFYASALPPTEFSPRGAVRLYRMTRAYPPPPSGFSYHSVRVKTPEELAQLKPALDILASNLNWQELPPLLAELEEKLKKQSETSPEARKLVEQYPNLTASILDAANEVFRGKFDVDDIPEISRMMKAALNLFAGREKDMVDAQISLLKELKDEKSPEAIRRLKRLLEQYELPELTSVAAIIEDRLNRLRLFELSIEDENTYEIKGPASIHNQLKKAFWILDDNFWIMQSNEPLTKFLHTQYAEGTAAQKRRPDFVCGTDAGHLIIVEIKRPSETITQDHLDQLEDYLETADEFPPKFRSKKGYLVGKSLSHRLQDKFENRKNMEFYSYTRLLDACKARYREYLLAIEKANRESPETAPEISQETS